MGRRRRTRIAFRFYVLLFVAICLFGYGVYIAVDRLVQRTAVIESGASSTQYTAQAVIVRSETLTDAEGLTSIKYHADEGAVVYKGNKIAEVYSTGYSQTDVNKLLNTRAQIKEYHKTLKASAYTDLELDRLDAQVLDYARELEQLIHGKAKGNLLNLERQLQTVLTNRQTHMKYRNTSDQNLIGLYDTEASLVKKIDSWTTTYLAVSDCIVSFYTDGYENMLGTTDLKEITAAQVRSVLGGEAPPTTTAQRGRTPVFRQVRQNGWYLLLLLNDSKWNPVEGGTYKVQLAGFEDLVIDAAVDSYSRTGNELLVRMVVGGDVRPVLNVRSAQATIAEDYVSGLKIPISALHVQSGQQGVVLVDNGGIFVPIDIIMQDENYYVISPKQRDALSEGQKIRVF